MNIFLNRGMLCSESKHKGTLPCVLRGRNAGQVILSQIFTEYPLSSCHDLSTALIFVWLRVFITQHALKQTWQLCNASVLIVYPVLIVQFKTKITIPAFEWSVQCVFNIPEVRTFELSWIKWQYFTLFFTVICNKTKKNTLWKCTMNELMSQASLETYQDISTKHSFQVLSIIIHHSVQSVFLFYSTGHSTSLTSPSLLAVTAADQG